MIKLSLLLLALGLCCSAAHGPSVPAGSGIYVEPGGGLDDLLKAAFEAHHVALRVVSSAEKADYTLESLVMPAWDNDSGRKAHATHEAAVKLTSKNGEVVWRRTVLGPVKKGDKALADDIAKHLKSIVAAAKP